MIKLLSIMLLVLCFIYLLKKICNPELYNFQSHDPDIEEGNEL